MTKSPKSTCLLTVISSNSGITIGNLGRRGEEFHDLLIEETEMLMLTRADAAGRQKPLSQIRQ
jgi:hypothetical protein